MEEIIKILSWPHFTFVFSLIFIAVFRKNIAELISRITGIDKSGVKASPLPEAQREDKKTEAVQELLSVVHDSVGLRNREELIKNDLTTRGLETNGDTVKVLIKHLASTKALLEFEQIHNLIFGSQIYLLKKLNEVIGQGMNKETVIAHFESVKNYHEELKNWSFEQYMAFLKTRSLVIMDQDNYHITVFGVDYLVWIVTNGRSENKAY